jgi:hypothetical protein
MKNSLYSFLFNEMSLSKILFKKPFSLLDFFFVGFKEDSFLFLYVLSIGLSFSEITSSGIYIFLALIRIFPRLKALQFA